MRVILPAWTFLIISLGFTFPVIYSLLTKTSIFDWLFKIIKPGYCNKVTLPEFLDIRGTLLISLVSYIHGRWSCFSHFYLWLWISWHFYCQKQCSEIQQISWKTDFQHWQCHPPQLTSDQHSLGLWKLVSTRSSVVYILCQNSVEVALELD